MGNWKIEIDYHSHSNPFFKVIGDDCVAANVLVKMEMQNPGGSIKDRIALSMIEEVSMQVAPYMYTH